MSMLPPVATTDAVTTAVATASMGSNAVFHPGLLTGVLPMPKLFPRPRRSPRPCDTCRLRKTRCVVPIAGHQCTMCQERNTPCTFEQKPPKRASRARQPEGERRGSSPRSSSRTGQTKKTRAAPPTYSAPTYPGQAAAAVLSSAEISECESQHSGSAATSSPSVRIQDTVMTERHLPQQNMRNGSRFLSLAPNTFAELYGITSDMEALLMVRFFSLVVMLCFLNCGVRILLQSADRMHISILETSSLRSNHEHVHTRNPSSQTCS